MDPWFSASLLTFLQNYGVVLAVPNLRGGGELGESWHLAAIREKKVCTRGLLLLTNVVDTSIR
jgi:prolyl oligopeptidase